MTFFFALVFTGMDIESIITCIEDLNNDISTVVKNVSIHEKACKRFSQRSSLLCKNFLSRKSESYEIGDLQQIRDVLEDAKGFISKFAKSDTFNKVALMKSAKADIERFEVLNQALSRSFEGVNQALPGSTVGRSHEDCDDLRQDMTEIRKIVGNMRDEVQANNALLMDDWAHAKSSINELVSFYSTVLR